MKVPTQYELTHLQLQAMLRENNIPPSEVKYLGEYEYTKEYKAHPEYHGYMMHWYLIDSQHEVPVCDIGSIERIDEE